MGEVVPCGEELDGTRAIGHPRPLLRRDVWWSLNGLWDFALDDRDRAEHPADVRWDSQIVVPFAPESAMSGIGDTSYHHRCWYRRTIEAPVVPIERRLILHFGAVDHSATVWIDGRLVVKHEGGYTPFSVDVTRELRRSGAHELVVLAEDDPLDLAKPRGKQDWEREPHSIWYERTTGVWQGVWLEAVHPVHVSSVQWHTQLSTFEVSAEIGLRGAVANGTTLRVRLFTDDHELVDDLVELRPGEHDLARGYRLDSTGLDHLRESLLWTPDHPVLVHAVIELHHDEELWDKVYSYTALRSVGVSDDGRFLLNGRPYYLRLVLDQGYWQESGLTPPNDDALRRDVELVKQLGFNGVRKHQKIEDPRYLHWADRLGLLVWVEMPPAYQFDATAVRRVTDEWIAVLERDRSHPSIVAWVPFNESTGLLNLGERTDQQQWVRALTALTRALDPTRPVVSNDGWETLGGDIIAVHDYEQRPEALAALWNGDLRGPLTGYGSHGRRQTLDEDPNGWIGGRPQRPIVLSEFGGVGWLEHAPVKRDDDNSRDTGGKDRVTSPAGWGYSTVSTVEEFEQRFRSLMHAVHSIPRLAGFCYTQFADTFQEINGLLTAGREPKLPVAVIARATRGEGKPYLSSELQP